MIAHLRRRAGHTLAEMMIVIVILGILFSIGPRLLIQLQNFFLMTTARNDIERDARTSLDMMNRMIRQAVDSTIIIDSANGGANYSRIRFRHVDGRYVQFDQSGSNLEMYLEQTANNGNLAKTILSKNLDYIAFSIPHSDDPTIVSVSMTMSKNIQLGKQKVLELTIQKVRVMN